MVRIITDSSSDILPAEALQKGVTVIPLKVMFGEKTYHDGVDLPHEQFYKLLTEAKTLPTTSQPTPADFEPFFRDAQQAGDSVVCILLSGHLSGTLQSAEIARELCGGENLYIIDSRQAIIGLRMLVELAVKMRGEGASAKEIASAVEEAKGRIRLYAMVDTLEYLHKGGRLSKTVAIVGTALKMKPILTLRDGKLEMLTKARGLDGSIEALLKILEKCPGIDKSGPVMYGYTQNAGQCMEFRERANARYGFVHTPLYSVGSAIGTHVGPNAMVIGFLEEK